MSNALMDKYFQHRKFLTDRGLCSPDMPEDPDPEDVYHWAARWIDALQSANNEYAYENCCLKHGANLK